MPKELHRKLAAQVVKSWPKERRNAYIYGTMRKMGWKPERERK